MNNRFQEPTLQELAKIQEKILTLRPDLEIKEILSAIAEGANRILRGNFCVVQPYQHSNDEFIVEQFTAGGNPKAKKFKWTVPRLNGTARSVLNQKSNILVIKDFNEAIKMPKKYPFLQGSGGAYRDIEPVRAYLGIRLEVGNEKLGVLFVDYLKPKTFSKQEISIAKLFAAQAAIAIYNTRLANSLGESLKIAGQLTREFGNSNQVLQTTIEQTVSLFGVTRGGIVFHESNGARLVASYDTRPNEDIALGLHFPISKLQKRIKNDRQPIIISDVKNDAVLGEDEREAFLDIGAKSTIILPLIARGEVIGSLGLDECKKIRTFTQRDLYLAQLLADLAAIAIDNARLFGIDERAIEGIFSVSERVLSEALKPDLNIDLFFNYVMQETLNLMEFDTGWLLIKEGDKVQIRVADSNHQKDLGRTFLVNECISGMCIIEKRLLNFQDLTNIPEPYNRLYKSPHGSTPMRSELVVPLMIGGDAIGAFNVESERPSAFNTRHERMLTLLSNQIALAIEIARLRNETRALNEIAFDLSRKTDVNSVLESIISHARTLIGAGYGQVELLEKDQIVVEYTTNKSIAEGVPPNDLGRRYEINDCVSGLAILERNSVIVPDVTKPEYLVIQFPRSSGSRKTEVIEKRTEEVKYKRSLELNKSSIVAELAIPFFSDNFIGVVNVETARLSGFTNSQQADLEGFIKSNQSRLIEQIINEDKNELTKSLNQILILAETEFGQILRREGNELIIEHTTGGEHLYTRVPIDRSVTGRATRKGTMEYVPNVSLDPDYQRYLGGEMKSELVVPLFSGEDVIGILNMESPGLNFFTSDHARIIESFAGTAAAAIERAKKFQGITLSEIGAIAGDVVHRLNNPLGAIGTRIELFKTKYGEKLEEDPYLRQFISRIERDLKDSKNIIQELRKTYKKGAPIAINLKSAIDSGIEKAELPEYIKRIVTADENIGVVASERLSYVLWNLFDNAKKAINKTKRTDGLLEITVKQENEWTLVRVRDNGIGIPPAQLELIWDPDVTTSTDANSPAHGLGLYWTKAMVESYGGEIFVESELGIGTQFTVKLRSANN